MLAAGNRSQETGTLGVNRLPSWSVRVDRLLRSPYLAPPTLALGPISRGSGLLWRLWGLPRPDYWAIQEGPGPKTPFSRTPNIRQVPDLCRNSAMLTRPRPGARHRAAGVGQEKRGIRASDKREER